MRVHVVFLVASMMAACNGAAVTDAPHSDVPVSEPAALGASIVDESPRETRAEREREQEQLTRNAIADRWRTEVVDPAWQAEREQELRNTIAAQPFPATTLRALHCRSTVCRMVVEHATVEDRERFFDATAGSAAFRDELFAYFPEPELRDDSEVWVAREGHRLRPHPSGD